MNCSKYKYFRWFFNKIETHIELFCQSLYDIIFGKIKPQFNQNSNNQEENSFIPNIAHLEALNTQAHTHSTGTHDALITKWIQKVCRVTKFEIYVVS